MTIKSKEEAWTLVFGFVGGAVVGQLLDNFLAIIIFACFWGVLCAQPLAKLLIKKSYPNESIKT